MPHAHQPLAKALVICLVLMVLAAGCERPSANQAGPAAQPVRLVEIVHLERHTVRRSVGEPGELQAFETARIHAKIAGYVKSWTVNIGAAVKTGQVLAELLVPELDAEVRQKEAAVEQAVAKHKQAQAAVKVADANVKGAEAKLVEVRASVKRADADLVFWQSQMDRVTALLKERAVTVSLLDETRSKLHSAESGRDEILAQVKTAEVAVTQAHAALDQARSDLGAAAATIAVAREDTLRMEALLAYTKIKAPFDGIVIQRNVDTGDLTQPGADKPPLFIIARSDIVTIRVDVPEAYAVDINPGDRVEIKLQTMNGKTIEAKVTRLSWALDPKTRTIRVEIDIPNPRGTLRPGLYAYATIVAEEHANVLTVPVTAVVGEKDKESCIVVINGKAVRRPIKVGLSDSTRTEVVSGVEGSDAVVKANAASLADGQPVQIDQPAAQ